MSGINYGQFSEALNNKMDRDANNIESPKMAIFLVAKQDPTAENNYTWYRKYSDGWVIQGGIFDAPSNVAGVEKTLSLPITMSNDKYTAIGGVHAISNDTSIYLFVATKTTTTVTFMCNVTSSALTQNWLVSGMAAS